MPCMCLQPAHLSGRDHFQHTVIELLVAASFVSKSQTWVGRPATHPLRCAGKRCDISICRIRSRHAGDAVRRCRTAFCSRPRGCLLCIRSTAAAVAAACAAISATPAFAGAGTAARGAPARAQSVHCRPRQAVEVAHYHCRAAGRQPLRRRQQHPRLGGLRGGCGDSRHASPAKQKTSPLLKLTHG